MSPRSRNRRARLGAIGPLAWLTLLLASCMSVSARVPILSDQSHLGTPYAGARIDLHVLICFARIVSKDASAVLLAPLALLHLIDLPFSAVADTILLPLDLPLEPDASPLVPGEGSCKLAGM